jgi:hypothetical protein
MALIDDQDPVQGLASDAAHDAFGDGVRSCGSHRCLDHVDAGRIGLSMLGPVKA